MITLTAASIHDSIQLIFLSVEQDTVDSTSAPLQTAHISCAFFTGSTLYRNHHYPLQYFRL